MKIKLNGQSKELGQPTNLQGVIKHYCPDHNRVVAELNGEIIKSPSWEQTQLKDGDNVELVSFVGGG